MHKLWNRVTSMSTQSKAAFWFAICALLQKGIQFLTTPIFTRILTTEQYGLTSVYLSWYSIFAVFLTLNLYQGGFNNGMLKNEGKRNEYLSAIQGLVITISVIEYVIFVITFKFWHGLLEMNMTMSTILFAEIVANSSLLLISAKARYEYQYKLLICFSLPMIVIPPIVSIFSIIYSSPSLGAEAKIYGNAISIILLSIPIMIFIFAKGKVFCGLKYWEYALKFNIPLIPHYLSVIFLNQIDRIMIKRMIGYSEAGIYSLAYSASMVLNVITSSINQSLSPWIYEKLKSKHYHDIGKRLTPIFVGVAFFILIFISFAPECILIFGGSKYSEAVDVVPAVSASIYFLFVYQVFSNIEFYHERNTYIAYASSMGAILNIVLNYYFIRRFGFLAAGYTTLICYIIFALCHYGFVRKIEKQLMGGVKVFNSKAIAGIGVLLLLFALVVHLLYRMILVRYIVIMIFALVIAISRKRIKDMIM